MENVFDISKLREKSVENRKFKKQDREKKFNEACELAFQKIIQNAGEKINESASNGNFSAVLHTWKYVSDMKDTDQLENSRFNGVWILDLLTKNNLVEKLENYFNKGNEDAEDKNKLKILFRKNKSNGIWNIIVKWSDPTISS